MGATTPLCEAAPQSSCRDILIKGSNAQEFILAQGVQIGDVETRRRALLSLSRPDVSLDSPAIRAVIEILFDEVNLDPDLTFALAERQWPFWIWDLVAEHQTKGSLQKRIQIYNLLQSQTRWSSRVIQRMHETLGRIERKRAFRMMPGFDTITYLSTVEQLIFTVEETLERYLYERHSMRQKLQNFKLSVSSRKQIKYQERKLMETIDSLTRRLLLLTIQRAALTAGIPLEP